MMDALPPEGLWVSPTGEQHDVNEHLLAIRDDPEAFGIPLSMVQGADIDALRTVAEGLIGQGWTRYRYLDGRHHFEADDARRRMGLIEDVLLRARAIPQEEVWISQVSPFAEFQGKVDDVFDRAILRFAGKEHNKWRFSRLG